MLIAAPLLVQIPDQGMGNLSTAPQPLAPAPQPYKKLVWRDEFGRRGLPDPKKWEYEVGYVRNDEKQFYTKGRKENARRRGGRLIIEARKDGWDGKPITSASISTEKSKPFLYGRIEVRAKVPTGKGTWPAIWTLGSNIRDPKVSWPLCGEIDLLENVGFDPDGVHHNVHTKAFHHSIGTNKGTRWEMRPGPYADFHVYRVDWLKDMLVWYVDGVERFRYVKQPGWGEAEWPFDKPQYLILNLAIGGGWGGQQGIDDAIFPAKLEIDWVRLYQ